MQTEPEMPQGETKQISARDMHKYVLILLGVFTLIAASFPTALMRVSQDKKFADYRLHVKSLTLEGKLAKSEGGAIEVNNVAANLSAQTINGSSANNHLQPAAIAGASQSAETLKLDVVNNLTAQMSGDRIAETALDGSQVSNPIHSVQAANFSSTTPEITAREKLAILNQKLYDQIALQWQSIRHGFENKVVYRVIVSGDGAIASYEPLNQLAKAYVQQTPLPNLLKSSDTTNPQTEIAKFEVAFTRRGILEVSPELGWRK